MNTFPDASVAASKLYIACELPAITHQSIFAESIRQGCKENLTSVIQMIKDQANDNRAMVAEIVGEELLSKILAL